MLKQSPSCQDHLDQKIFSIVNKCFQSFQEDPRHQTPTRAVLRLEEPPDDVENFRTAKKHHAKTNQSLQTEFDQSEDFLSQRIESVRKHLLQQEILNDSLASQLAASLPQQSCETCVDYIKQIAGLKLQLKKAQSAESELARLMCISEQLSSNIELVRTGCERELEKQVSQLLKQSEQQRLRIRQLT